MIINLLKALVLRLFPNLGYKGVVNTQVKLYKGNIARGVKEQEALNRLIISRVAMSFAEKEEAERAYGHLLNNNSKTLKDVIKAIVLYEYFESSDSKKIISTIPSVVVQKTRKEYMDYIESYIKE